MYYYVEKDNVSSISKDTNKKSNDTKMTAPCIVLRIGTV